LTIWLLAFLLIITYVFKYLNGTCKPILNIYVPRAFQWYKEIFKPMSFDPFNCLLKTSTPKVRTHLEMCGFMPSHFPTLSRAWNVIPRLHSWPATLQALALVTSPRLGSWHFVFKYVHSMCVFFPWLSFCCHTNFGFFFLISKVVVNVYPLLQIW
jgi:hypothetical protein